MRKQAAGEEGRKPRWEPFGSQGQDMKAVCSLKLPSSFASGHFKSPRYSRRVVACSASHPWNTGSGSAVVLVADCEKAHQACPGVRGPTECRWEPSVHARAIDGVPALRGSHF